MSDRARGSRSTHAPIGWLMLAASAAALACYSPKLEDGALGCAAEGTCPRGFVCRLDRRCWRTPDLNRSLDGGDDRGPPAGGGDDGGEARGGAGERGAAGTAGSGAGASGTSGAAGSQGGAGSGGAQATAGAAGGAHVDGAAGGGVDRPEVGVTGAGGTGAIDAALDAPVDASRKTNGAPCAKGAECASNFCVDGLCCDTACSGACEACDTTEGPGRCLPVIAGPPHGARPGCTGTGTCAGSCTAASRAACTFPANTTACRAQACSGNMLVPAALCDGAGACATSAARACAAGLVCNDSGTACLAACRTDVDCLPPTPYCSAKACTAARPNGVACSSDGQCQSGQCVDGICCDRACTDSCQACDVAGHVGTCWPVPSHESPHAARGACSGTGPCAGFCNGSAAQCVFPGAETTCPCSLLSGTCNGAGQCAMLGSLCL